MLVLRSFSVGGLVDLKIIDFNCIIEISRDNYGH